VHLLCPLEISIEREFAERWCPGPWTSGGCAAPDICADYEESPTADLTVHTHVVGHWSAVDQGVWLARRLLRGGGHASTLGSSKGGPT